MTSAVGDAISAIRLVIPWLALGHGFFNAVIMISFFYQGWLGFNIWKSRKAGAPAPLAVVRRHRRVGPVLVMLGMAGFFAGLLIVLIDKGNPLEYPLHFFVGLFIVLCLVTTYLVSRRIRTREPAFRTTHRLIGILILCSYPVQAFLGLGILL